MWKKYVFILIYYLGYKIIDHIGEGSFSQVVKCLDTKTGAYVAAKTLKKRYETYDFISLFEIYFLSIFLRI